MSTCPPAELTRAASLTGLAAGVVSILGAFVPSASGTVIYNCRSTTPSSIFVIADGDETSSFTELPGLPTDREFESRVGDLITFAGNDRLVTNFSTRLTAFGGTPRGFAVAVELSIYESSGGLPGALLWSGVNPNVVIPASPQLVSVEAMFTPNIMLPDTVCFAIGFTNIVRVSGETRIMGVATHSAPTIGSSPVTTIHQLSADNTWFIEDINQMSGGIFRNVEARVEAIPAPATIAALFLALPFSRRRRQA